MTLRFLMLFLCSVVFLADGLPAHAASPAPAPDAPAAADAGDMEEEMDESGMPAAAKKKDKKSFDNSRTDIVLFNRTVSDKNRVKSILYTPTEVKDIHLAINTYLKYIGRGGELTFDEEAFLSRLGGLKKNATSRGQAQFFTYPQFFLDSLVYYEANDWIVWINGEKITQDTPKESKNIRVTSISPDKITVEWFPLEMNRVMEIWKRYPNEEVTVQSSPGMVSFTLKPNQTFSSYTMSVLEGRVLPVTVDSMQSFGAMPVEEGGASSDSQAPTEDAASETEGKEGLGGLINSYKHIQKEN